MTPEQTRLDRLVDSVSDGSAVNWEDDQGAAADPHEQASIVALRHVARIAEFNRGLQRADAPAPAEPSRWGDLLLLEQVGAGTRGVVWRAWDPRLQREVALKLLHEAGGESAALLAEARALAGVRHANVVTVHGLDDCDGRTGIWMEFLRGESLADVMEARGPLAAGEVRELGLALVRALGAIHRAGLVHRDVKPANVVMEPQGRVVLTDFGLGVRQFRAGREPASIAGTPMFMAPERLAGAPATPRSDLYALGVTLRMALTGRTPFPARTVAELQEQAQRGPATALAAECPHAPPALVRAIERAMAPDPNARFASAQAMEVALSETGSAAVNRGTPGRRTALVAVLVIVALEAGAVIAGLVLRGRAHSPAGSQSARAGAGTGATSPAAGAGTGTTAGAVAPSPDAAAAYDVSALLMRRGREGDRRLTNGDRVTPGDRLSLSFHASRPVWVYVLDEDERGQSFLLFPQPLFDRTNPLPADQPVVLPGTIGGRENGWTVTSRGGREHILVVASPTPVREIESELGRIPAPRPDRPIVYARVSGAAMERLRGVGGVAPVPEPAAPRRAGVVERFAALAGRETGVRGVWVRQITLENPVR
jgi:eukaryotic-like serine/threonine-protein kinase